MKEGCNAIFDQDVEPHMNHNLYAPSPEGEMHHESGFHIDYLDNSSASVCIRSPIFLCANVPTPTSIAGCVWEDTFSIPLSSGKALSGKYIFGVANLITCSFARSRLDGLFGLAPSMCVLHPSLRFDVNGGYRYRNYAHFPDDSPRVNILVVFSTQDS
jgi:hypothetical protein